MKYVKCKFLYLGNAGYPQDLTLENTADREYTYKVPEFLSTELTVGDLVVCSGSNGLQVTVISEINVDKPSGYNGPFSQIVGVVDATDWRTHYLVQNRKSMIMSELTQLKKILEEQNIRVEDNPKFASLMDELKSLM